MVSNVLGGRKPWQFSDKYRNILQKEIILTKIFLKLMDDRIALNNVIKGLKRWGLQ